METIVFIVVVGLLVAANPGYCKNKTYYLAIEETIWDYAPSGLNLVTNNRLQDEPISRIYSDMYIGKKYKKAIYRGYTDDTYQTPLPHDPNLGFMGPTLRAEVGDRIFLHLFNKANRSFSAHPHGLFYTKGNEGAFYGDNSTEKLDDAIPPGGRFTYEWEARPEFGPTQGDTNCLTWAYHSHTHSPVDIYSGLIGALIVCRPGTYRDDESRKDVDHEFVAMVFVVNERDSWYFQENLQTLPDWENVDINEKYFVKGNKMHVVNGNMYGNTPGYDVCQGDTISWHVLGMGSNRDLHPIQFQGQTMINQHHREDSLILIPATLSTMTMRANNPGRWLIACKLYSHFTEGMTAWLTVDPSCKNSEAPSPSDSLTGQTRDYFIAAEEVLWNYGPSGINKLDNTSLVEPGSDAEVFFKSGPDRIGGVYEKAVYRQYTNASFTDRVLHRSNLGILGPVIAGEIGDTIRIVFKNTASNRAYNMEPQGVYFQSSYPTPPNSQRTYRWTLPDDVAPTDEDPNCLTYLYTSSVSYIPDSNSGLIGPLLVCKRGTLESEMTKPHRYIMMTVFDENKSWYFKDNVRRFISNPAVNKKDGDFKESNLMHSINGLMFGNLQLDLCTNEDTRLHVFAVGTKVDIHGVNFEGINFRLNGASTGVVDVFAHTAQTVTLRPEYDGEGRFFCRTIDHTISGMTGIYKARSCGSDDEDASSTQEENHVREPPYFIAAEEVIWDYNERGLNSDGESVNNPENHGYEHCHHEPGRLIGSRYKKVLYFEYTDETFTVKKPKPVHLGIMGPIIRGAVGDTIKVVFRNKANRPYNMQPWGAIDFAADTLDSQAVQPGETKEYYWKIPESASPLEHQPTCQSFIYMSSVDPAIDPLDGLMGPLLVCKRGSLSENSMSEDPVGVDEEFFLQFAIIDENMSHYLDENIRYFLKVDPATFEQTDQFVESNKMKAINGFVWHVDGLTMRKDDTVRWHLIGWGNEKDYHSVHFHANTYIHVAEGGAYRGDVFDVFPGFLGTVEMVVVEVGDWLLHCHVFDHIHGGMETTYSVIERADERPTLPQVENKRNCEMKISHNREEINCNKMNISAMKDFTRDRSRMDVIMPNGSVIDIDVSSVRILKLSHNFLTRNAVKTILRHFNNLRELNLNHNQLDELPAGLLKGTPHLDILKVKRNPHLLSVPKGLVRGKVNRGIPRWNFKLLDLSDNSQLRPSCLNRVFTNPDTFLSCLDN